jgi:hypothetical protein
VWLTYGQGEVVVKNPDEPTIAKMIAIAGQLGARVEGDDGETYGEPGETPTPATASLADRFAVFMDRWRPKPRLEPVSVPFRPGDRVRNAWGHEGVIVAIDLSAEQGLGLIRVKMDDGRELTSTAAAHGLTAV